MRPGRFALCDREIEAMGTKCPTIVCLCGSTRFMEAFLLANLNETLAGKIVLTVGCDTKSDEMLGLSADVKADLDELHLRKIDLAKEVLILNVGGYVGESCSREICYAERQCKLIRWLVEPVGLDLFEATDQGRCDCCDRAAGWLRFGGKGRVSARCDRHAWVSEIEVAS